MHGRCGPVRTVVPPLTDRHRPFLLIARRRPGRLPSSGPDAFHDVREALTRVLPLHRAKELALLGETIGAHEAHELGLLNRLCEPDEIDAVVKDYAQRLAALPPRTVAQIKENLNRAPERSIEENLEAESAAQSLVFTSEDTREAVMAWVEKREPHFKGR